METLIAFVIAAAVTLVFVRRYLRSLAPAKARNAGASPAVAVKTSPCPRCSQPVPQSSAFCGACGAPMALWNVHRAAVAEAGAPAATGKPKPVINTSMCIGCGSCVHACPETGTLELAGGKAILAHPDRCTGHAKCVEVCPTQAIALSFGGVLQTMKVPLVNENFETNVEGVFIAGELGGMGLIKTAINEGRLAIDRIKRRLDSAPHPNGAGGDVYDVAIVGSGPAGLSAALTAHQHEMKYVALEQGEIAQTIRQYPRHKFLMAEPLEMPLYGSLYIADSTKESLLAVWETIIANTGVQVRTNTRVESVARQGSVFRIETSSGPVHARFVVLATGKRGTPRRLDVPGEDLPKVSYRLIEADSYDAKDVFVAGGGDSAIEAALALARSGRNRVTLCHRSADFARARERNRAHLQTAQEEKRLTVMMNSKVVEIRPDSVIVDRAGEPITLPNDYVFVLIGGESPEGFLRKIGVEIVEKSVSAQPAAFA